MRARIASVLLAVVLALALPLSSAWAAKGDLDEIVNYQVKVDVNEDATLHMVYHIEWKVLDSKSEGPLSWVLIGIPNKHYVSVKGLSKTIKSIKYDKSQGDCVRIDLDKKYYAGEVVSFDFELVQDYMYQVDRDNKGETVYEFTPGWFDEAAVDNLEIRWNADKVERIAPAAQQDKGYYTWRTALKKKGRYTVTVGYANDAFAFDIDKNIEQWNKSGGTSSSSSDHDWVYGLVGLAAVGLMMWGSYQFLKVIANAFLRLFEMGSGFTTGKKITRTKVVYYPICQGCGAPRPEGKDTCDYCGRSFIQSEEVITEKDIPAQERAIRGKSTEGEYAYSSEPNTFLRVHVVPIPVSTGSRHRSSGSSSHSSCACACACGCACACACAGGGRAGCTTKDFYNTNLKLSQLEEGGGAKT